MIAFVAGLFGLIIGSFLNVVILRHRERPLTGRSACMACGEKLAWYDLIPLVSYVSLGGRCRGCKERISLQYPAVEAATAVLFALIADAYFHTVPLLSLQALLIVPYLAIAALLIAITVYDLYHKIIPNEWAYLFAALALITSMLSLPYGASAVWLLVAGPLAAAPLFFLWAISRGTWMGLGDPKLALGMGWLLGPWLGLMAVMLAFIIGAVVSLTVLIPVSALRHRHDRITMKSEVPFGPFLVASTLIVWLGTMYGLDFTYLFR